MSPAPGAHRNTPEAAGLPAAASGFISSAARFSRALAGLFGLELQETGLHALVLAGLAVALIASTLIAYLFLLAGLVFFIVSRLDGGWLWVLLTVGILHVLAAAGLLYALVFVGRRPLFPATREAVRREIERIS